MNLRRLLLLLPLLLALFSARAHAQSARPPLITTTGTSTLGAGGRPWAFLALGESKPGAIASRRLAVYLKTGNADSSATFAARGLIGPVNDPTAISVLLSRAVNLGENLGALEAQLVALHQVLLNAGTNPPPAMTLPVRLAALMNRAASDSSLGQLLDAYALAHPALRLVRGSAWAGPLDLPVGSPVTFEVREQSAAGSDLSVIGRVTVLAGQGEMLPAPGPIVVVPETSSGGDLLVRLRWATPDPLRALGARHHGDVLWRVDKGFAESRQFQNTAPTAATLDGLVLSGPASVRRLSGPIYPSKLFSAVDVADFVADSATVFETDNNNRYAAGGAPAAEGAQYYYFVAAADALGRPGAVSAGVLGQFCRRLPPVVPRKFNVANRWKSGLGQCWDLRWDANLLGDGTRVTRYELFRGTDLQALAKAQRGELNFDSLPIVAGEPDAIKRTGVVPDPGASTPTILRFTDPGEGAPGTPWWFAIRAVHEGPPGCGSIASSLSPPVFSTLPLREAPLAASPDDITALPTECLLVGCIRQSPAADEISPVDLDVSALQFVARCAGRPGISGCHFRVVDLTSGAEIVPDTLAIFAEGDPSVEVSWSAPLNLAGHQFDVQCAAEAIGSVTSVWAHSQSGAILPDGNHQMAHQFLAGAIGKSELPDFPSGDALWDILHFVAPPPWPADLHLAVSPSTGRIFPPSLCLALAPGTEQYRVYRRVNDGPLTLMAQGLQSYVAPGCARTIVDPAPPPSNGRVQYFAQLLDEHGHASAMRSLRDLRFTGVPPPVPLLVTPAAADFGGQLLAPTITLSWICPPEHVERFEVYFETAKLPTDPDQGVYSPLGVRSILANKPLATPAVFKVSSKLPTLGARIVQVNQSFLTGRVGGDLGAGPKFTVIMQVDPTLKYTVWIRSLGPNAETSTPSRSIVFQWQPPAAPPTDVAWPARPLPPVAAFNPGIQAIDFATLPADRLIWWLGPNGPGGSQKYPSVDPAANPVGIRLGSLPIDNGQSKFGFATDPPTGPVFQALASSSTAGKGDPNLQVFHHVTDPTKSLLPCVLYRQQVANDAFPAVSGDVIQCSPLVRSIAWESVLVNGRTSLSKLTDPFFCWIGPLLPTYPSLDLYLFDTQPVVTGARYRYWLLRFSALGEPIQTIPCGEVTIQGP